MKSFFFDIALPRLSGLTSFGASVATELASKCDIITIRKRTKRIDVFYEPYGPPFCDVTSDNGDVRRIELDIAFHSAQRMGRGDKTADALSALQNDLKSYIEALYPVLVEELSCIPPS